LESKSKIVLIILCLLQTNINPPIVTPAKIIIAISRIIYNNELSLRFT